MSEEKEIGFETDGSGQAIEDAFDDITGGMEPAGAVAWYGILALGMAVTSLTLYLLFDGKRIGAYTWAMYAHQAVWWPVGMVWLTMQFWDNEVVRYVFELAVTMSWAGPYLLYWVAFAMSLFGQ